MSTGWFLIPIAGVLVWAAKISNPNLKVRLEWKVEDCWIGAFWKTSYDEMKAPGWQWRTDLWICLLPMLPLHFTWPCSTEMMERGTNMANTKPRACPSCGDEHEPHCRARPGAEWASNQAELAQERRWREFDEGGRSTSEAKRAQIEADDRRIRETGS